MNNAESLDKEILAPFQKIFAVMGISTLQIELSAENFSLLELSDAERESLSKGMPIDPKIFKELMKNLAPLVPFTYKEHIVLVYIRDQYLTRANYAQGNYNRFHLCFCQALRAAKKNNRYEARFVMTYDTGGNFLVNLFADGERREQNVYRRLKVCQYCLREINWKNFRRYCGAGLETFRGGNKTMRLKIVEEFDIAEYLLTAQKNKTDFPPVDFTIKKEYVLSPQWKAALKKNVAYTCEICGEKFSPEDLEIHHKNHNQGDNRRDNLMVLCRDCHNKIHSVEGGVFVKRKTNFEYADALKTLGDIYSAINDEKAAKNFYRKASVAYEKLSGDLDAKFELANLYLRDLKTLSKAQQLFESYLRRAASGGAKEMIRCGLIYAKALGMPKNFAKAHMFFEKAQLIGGEEIFIDSEYIEMVKLFQYSYAGKLRAQAIEIFDSAAQGGSAQAVGELVKFYSDKNFLSDFAEDDSLKNFFDDAQKLFVEILKDSKATNNFP